MKKIVIVVAGIVAACILVTGIFSAGLVVGGLVLANRNQPEISQAAEPADIGSAETESASPSEPTVAPTEEKSLLSELNPFKDDEPEDTPPPAPTSDMDELFAPFWEAWEIVNKDFVDQPVDQEAMMRGAIQGMLDCIRRSAHILYGPRSIPTSQCASGRQL